MASERPLALMPIGTCYILRSSDFTDFPLSTVQVYRALQMYETGSFVKDSTSKHFFSEANWGLNSKHELLIEDIRATIDQLTEPDWKDILLRAERARIASYRGGVKKHARSISSLSEYGALSGPKPKKRKGLVINRRPDA